MLGLPLSDVTDSPLVVWPGSHAIIADAFRTAFQGVAPRSYSDIDVTDIYQKARQEVFQTCRRVEVPARLGEATLMHRHLIHGVAPWDGPAQDEGRIVAYFRPLVAAGDWL